MSTLGFITALLCLFEYPDQSNTTALAQPIACVFDTDYLFVQPMEDGRECLRLKNIFSLDKNYVYSSGNTMFVPKLNFIYFGIYSIYIIFCALSFFFF